MRRALEAILRASPSRHAAWAVLLCLACQRNVATTSAETPAASASVTPIDRLRPDELSSGSAAIWGFPVPSDMHVEHHYQEVAYIIGPVKADALSNYVRDRVLVSHVEIGAGRTIFPNAKIKGGAPDGVYEFDVIPEPGATRLVIHDLTPPKIIPGLTDAERWRQAGLTPQGRPLDMKKFE